MRRFLGSGLAQHGKRRKLEEEKLQKYRIIYMVYIGLIVHSSAKEEVNSFEAETDKKAKAHYRKFKKAKKKLNGGTFIRHYSCLRLVRVDQEERTTTLLKR